MSGMSGIGKSIGISTVDTAPQAAEAVMAEIQGVAQQLAGLSADLMALIEELKLVSEQLRDHMASKPVYPGDKASGAAKAKFAADTAAWNAEIQNLNSKITSLQGRIELKEKETALKEKELGELQVNKLPLATAKDRAALEAQIQRARDQAEAAREAAAPAGADSLQSSEANAAEKRKLVLGQAPQPGSGIPND